MKKIMTLFTILGVIFISGCSITNNQTIIDLNSSLDKQTSLSQEQSSGLNDELGLEEKDNGLTNIDVNKAITSDNCAKEGEIYNNGIDAQGPFSCCNGLKGFTERNIDGKYMPLCYDPKKGEPTCIIDGHRLEGRYYSNGDLLKQDVNCK